MVEKNRSRSRRLSSRILLPVLVAATMVVSASPEVMAGAASGGSATRLAVAVDARPEVVAPMTAATQMTSFDAQMIGLVNRARVQAGVPQLTEAKGLTSLAVWWSNQLNGGATGYQLQHNPNAWSLTTKYGAANRTTWGENVAWSSSASTSAQSIFTAYMNSPGHKANILSKSYHYIGMGTMSGPHGLWNTTEFTDAVQPGQAVSGVAVVASVPSNGDFFRDASTNVIYRLVGGAPILVSSWTPFGGAKTLKVVRHVVVAAMPKYPADGTFLRTAGAGQVFRVTGGAPVFVSSWRPFGKIYPTTDIDPAAITHAGGTGDWSHLRAVPADGTFVRTYDNGAIYRIVGGAPLWIQSWTTVGGVHPFQPIDPQAIAHGGLGGVWAHLKWYPNDNTYIQGNGSSHIYRVLSGRATYVPTWASVGGVKPFTVVPAVDISKAGTGGKLNHLKA